MAQKERIDKMTLDQYLQSPQMTAEEILYARQVKFASYTEARKDVFPTFVAELSGWNFQTPMVFQVVKSKVPGVLIKGLLVAIFRIQILEVEDESN
ncbi:hypothetical protein [Streptococcus suis]|uniref:hypothetical protein n=1 Tax=Streptococcus suis TaxID=1307 RepID=UPI0003FB20C2|nr:hypothetical protein [Streptococcus suis]